MTITPVDPDRAAEVRSLVTMLDRLLEKIVAAYEQANVPLPERRYWTLSTPAWDCEQLVLSFVQAYVGPPGDEASEPQHCNSPLSAAIDVQVVRCIPTIGARNRIPSAEQIQEGSKALLIDAYLLLDISKDLDVWDEFGPGLGVIATVDVGEPQTGFQAVTLHLTAAIP